MSKRSTLPLAVLVLALPLQGIGLDVGIFLSLDVMAAVIFVVAMRGHLRLLQPRNYDGLILLFFAWAAVSLLVSALLYPELFGGGQEGLRFSSLRGLMHLGRLGVYFLLFIGLRNYLASREERFADFFRLLMIICTVLAVYGLYQFLALNLNLPFGNVRNIRDPEIIGIINLGLPQNTKRVMGFSEEPENYASLLLMFVPLVLASWFYRRAGSRRSGPGVRYSKPSKLFYAAVIGALLLALGLTFSRSGIVVLSGGLLVALVFPRVRILTVGVGAAVSGVLLLVVLGAVSLPLAGITSRLAVWQVSDISSSSRLFVVENAIRETLARPLVGLGLGLEAPYQAIYWYDAPGSVQAIGGFWTNIGMDTGIIGLSLLGSFVIIQMWRLFFLTNTRSGWPPVLRSVGLAVLMTATQMILVNGAALYPYFWVTLAVGAASWDRSRGVAPSASPVVEGTGGALAVEGGGPNV